jgi:hypothetical protein
MTFGRCASGALAGGLFEGLDGGPGDAHGVARRTSPPSSSSPAARIAIAGPTRRAAGRHDEPLCIVLA